ncbi:hypothetical protein C0J52_00656 [Blattella germanica]|nr:hypothetical protein C0J52_00656 [Blattella germanica]
MGSDEGTAAGISPGGSTGTGGSCLTSGFFSTSGIFGNSTSCILGGGCFSTAFTFRDEIFVDMQIKATAGNMTQINTPIVEPTSPNTNSMLGVINPTTRATDMIPKKSRSLPHAYIIIINFHEHAGKWKS